jgi:hypothetical protein
MTPRQYPAPPKIWSARSTARDPASEHNSFPHRLGVVSIHERGRDGENEHPHLQTTDPRCIDNFANVNRVAHRYFPGHHFSN